MNLCRGAAAIALAVICSGCQMMHTKSPEEIANREATRSERPSDLKQHLRNNSASLLYDLLNDEKDLGKLLLIKRTSNELNGLVKEISAAARDGVATLEQLARADRTLNLHVPGLPSGEVAARDAIAKTKEHDLLHASGAELTVKLLLTQVEALNYGSHLAKVAEENSALPEQAREFQILQTRLNALYKRVVQTLSANALTS